MTKYSVVKTALIASVLLALVGAPVFLAGVSRPSERPVGTLGTATLVPTPTVEDLGPTATTGGASAMPSVAPVALDCSRPVDIKVNFAAWSMVNLRTGQQCGSKNATDVSLSASMIKAWLASDFLSLHVEAGKTPTASELATLSTMIRDSSNDAATTIYNSVGGKPTLGRLKETCGLMGTPYISGAHGWGSTYISAWDAATLGACIYDGRATTPYWRDWLLNEMRNVRGTGNFGTRRAFSASEQPTIAIKNGWIGVPENRQYYLNCLAIGDGWALAVETHLPALAGEQANIDRGAGVCIDVTNQLRGV